MVAEAFGAGSGDERLGRCLGPFPDVLLVDREQDAVPHHEPAVDHY